MKKFLKIVVAFIVLVILSTAGLLGYLTLHRDEIHDSIKNAMCEKLQANVQFDKTDFTFFKNFPDITVELKNVLIADSLFDVYKTPVLHARSIYLKSNFWKLLALNIDVRRLTIDSAGMRLFTCANGYSNDYIFKNLSSKKDTTEIKSEQKSNTAFNIERVELKNVSVRINDSIHTKYIGFDFKSVAIKLNRSDSILDVMLNGNIFMEGLTFKQRKGTFLNKQELYLSTHLAINAGQNRIEILPSKLNVHKAKFDLSGYIRTGEAGELKLVLHSDAVLLEDTKAILTNRIYSKLAKFSFAGPLFTDFELRTPLKSAGKDPYITVKAKADNISTNLSGFIIDSVSFDGQFKNFTDSLSEPDDVNSVITFNNFKGNASGLKLKGTVQVSDFSNTIVAVKVSGNANLHALQGLVDENSIELRKGVFNMNIDFKANVSNLYDSINDKTNGRVIGTIGLKDGIINYKPKNLLLTDVNASISGDQTGMHINSLKLKYPGSDLSVKGEVSKMVAFFISTKPVLNVEASIESVNMNLEPLLSESKNQAHVASASKNKQKLEQTVSKTINRILMSTAVDASMKIDHAYYHKFNAYNASGKISIHKGKAAISDFNFEHARGKVKYNASLNKIKTGFAVSFKATASNINMPDLLESFENFHQKSLTGKNINGIVSLELNASGSTNQNLILVPGSLIGNFKVNIVDGQLNNFEPLVNMSRFIFKNRGLDSIRFSTIVGAADIKGEEIELHKMIVLSSAIAMAIDGTYSFGDKTDLSIQVPLKNLKANSPEYFSSVSSFENYKGANVYLRGRTENGALKFSYDPLKKMRKSKKKNNN